MNKKLILKGNKNIPPVNGGYIYIYKYNNELHIASVPSFNITADNYLNSMVDNTEFFSDNEKNEYIININSNRNNVEWELEIFCNKQDEPGLIDAIKFECEINIASSKQYLF